jgi:hypothetical protein
MKKVLIAVLLLMLFSLPSAYARQLYGSDFESEPLGGLPQGWEQLFEGNGEAKVIEDPAGKNNKVLASSDMPHDQSRHDAGGSIFGVGEDSWKDYIIEYDAYFPADFYMGILFRFQDPEAFYLFDRRSAGEAGNFDFWRRQAGSWTGVQRAGVFETEPEKWYRFRVVVSGNTFEAYAKSEDASAPFEDNDLILTGSDDNFDTGKFGLYGLIYIDNLVIGETEADLVLSVEPGGKLAASWGKLKLQ